MFRFCRTTTDQGNVAQARAIYELQRLGYVILIPITVNQKYDLVIEKDGILSRVQVKSTTFQNKYGHYTASLALVGPNNSGHKRVRRAVGDYDYLFVLTEESKCYFIHVNDLGGFSSITLSPKYEKFLMRQ